MTPTTKTNRIEIPLSCNAVESGFQRKLDYAHSLARLLHCMTGGFYLEAHMKEPRIFSPVEFKTNPEAEQDFNKIYEQGESEVSIYV
jgi:hypothetical protein